MFDQKQKQGSPWGNKMKEERPTITPNFGTYSTPTNEEELKLAINRNDPEELRTILVALEKGGDPGELLTLLQNHRRGCGCF